MSALEQTECHECGQIIHYQPQRWKSQVVCSNCQTSFAVEATAPPPPSEKGPTPLPSHLQQPEAAVNPGGGAAQEQSQVPTHRYQRSKIGGVIFASILVVLIGGAVIGGIWGLALLDSNTARKEKAEKDKQEEVESKKKIVYAEVGKKGAKLGKIQVNIKLVEFGPLRVKDQSNRVHVSSDSLLQIFLEIRSRFPGDVNYVSWYGNSFDRSGKQVVAQLSDQNGTVFNMPVFGDVKGLFGHTPKATLERNERAQDCVVFELPAGTAITDIKELKLALPMECFGRKGTLYFKIPQEEIQLVAEEDGN